MKVIFTVSADKNAHTLVNGRITDHGKRNFEWSLNSWLRNRLLEVDA